MAYIHPQDQAHLDRLLKDLPQSLLLSGPRGIGLNGITGYIATAVEVTPFVVQPEKNEKTDLLKGSISVEAIRRLYDTTKHTQTTKQVIIIDEVDKMSVGAQNAFLKLLEEPGESVHFLLLSHSPSQLLPTILSRVHHVPFRTITNDQSYQLLNELGIADSTKRNQLLFIAEGLPAELSRLVENSDYFDTRSQIVRDARTFLQGTAYEKLRVAATYKDSREDALTLLNDSARLLKQSLTNTTSATLLQKIATIMTSYERIEANGNVRLWLAQAVV